MLREGKAVKAIVMENRSIELTRPEQLEQWVNNAAVALSASMVFGRDKASQIAQPLLFTLFTLTSNDFKKALETIVKINDFSVKRILLEQFKYCYIVNTGSGDLLALVSKVDFSSQRMSDEYDSVLLKLYNENDKDFTLLSESLSSLPIKARRVALKRLHSEEFKQFKKVKIRSKRPEDHSKKTLIKTWYWILICVGAAAVALSQNN